MDFLQTPINGAVIVQPQRHSDERGYFARTWCKQTFQNAGLPTDLSQCNLSFNPRKGTLRGMHLQKPPHAEAKLVRCVAGAALDVAIDLRPDSPTFKQWASVEITAEKGNAFYIPKGCAHGFLTLTENTELFYMMSDPYVADAGYGVRWNDPQWGIEWPFDPVVISDRDNSYEDFVS